MDYETISKLIVAIISSFGTIALINYNLTQSKKGQAELLERFDIALSKNNKHSVSELFRLIHGLRMNYEDILALVKDDNCSKIIFGLKANSSQVKFENGKFAYVKNGHHKTLRKLATLYNKFTSYICVLGFLICFSLIPFVKPSEYPIAILGIILCTAGVIFGLREYNLDKMIDNLVDAHKSKKNQDTDLI